VYEQGFTPLQQQLPNLEQKKKVTEKELGEARNEAIDFSAIESDLGASEVRVKESERDIKDTEKALKDLKKSEEKILELQKQEKNARANLSGLEALCEQLELQQREWKEQVDNKAKEVRLAEELTRDARILWTISDTLSKVDELEKKRDRIKEIEQEIETLRKNEISIFPSDKELRQLLNPLPKAPTISLL
jgi:chromosome segregation ATPase